MSAEPIDNSLVQPDNEIAVAKADNPEMVPGRRDFLQYRELGVTKASEGKILRASHLGLRRFVRRDRLARAFCEGQFVYMLSGWVDLEFAGGRKERVGPGDLIYIPGGTPHNETATSDAFELLEVSIPADMGTVPCDKPD